MVHYEPVKITINIPGLEKVIIDMMVQYHGLPDSINSDCKAILCLSSGHHSITSLTSRDDSPLHFTLK